MTTFIGWRGRGDPLSIGKTEGVLTERRGGRLDGITAIIGLSNFTAYRGSLVTC